MVKGLPYYGGKSPIMPRCKWINSVIGRTPGRSYCEPFAGMLGVLLGRERVATEVANDANGFVVSWWRAVRDMPEEFGRRIQATPRSLVLFDEAVEAVLRPCSGDLLADALAFHICVEQSMAHGPVPSRGSWSVTKSPNNRSIGKWTGLEVAPLASRIADVQLENRDALEILDWTKNESEILIYADPPYRSATTRPYGKIEIDWDRLAALFQAQKGMVAISGYGDEWDALGWHKSEFSDTFQAVGRHAKGAARETRVECLWTNFASAQKELF